MCSIELSKEWPRVIVHFCRRCSHDQPVLRCYLDLSGVVNITPATTVHHKGVEKGSLVALVKGLQLCLSDDGKECSRWSYLFWGCEILGEICLLR